MNKIKILDIFYGNICNLTCFQCDTRSDIFRKGQYDKDIENIKQSITLAKKHFEIEVYALLGGEPLMYLEKIEEILKFIRSFDNQTPIVIPTNGSLIEKYFEKFAQLISSYKLQINVCNHFSAFDDQERANNVRSSSIKLAEYLDLNSTDPSDFFYNVLNYSDPNQVWQDWLTQRGGINNVLESGQYWTHDGMGIFLHDQDTFLYNHNIVNGMPKPFAEGDPEKSYLNGCCSPFCTYLYDKKLYKCGSLGTLKRFLDHHNLLEDKDWSPYLQYKPLDLENCTTEEATAFSDNKFKAIKECDMCPSYNKEFIKTPDTVLPGKKYVHIKRVE